MHAPDNRPPVEGAEALVRPGGAVGRGRILAPRAPSADAVRSRKRRTKIRDGAVTAAFDVAGALLSAGAAYWSWGVLLDGEHTWWHAFPVAAVGLAWVLGLLFSRSLKRRMRRSLLDELPEIVRHVLVAAMAVALVSGAFSFGVTGAPSATLECAGLVVLAAAAGCAFAPLARGAGYAALNRRARKRVVVVGAGRVGQRVAGIVGRNPRLRAEVVGFLDGDPLLRTRPGSEDDGPDPVEGYPVLGSVEDLGVLLAADAVDEVIVAFARAPHQKFLDMIWECSDHGVEISFVPRLYETTTVQSRVENVGGVPLMHLNRVRLKGANAFLKRTFDLVLTSVGLLLVWPLLLLLALAVWLEDGGPILFAQERVGPGGKTFKMYKFRSMRRDAESLSTWTRRADPRRTRVGKLMRPLNLDELPQIFNVLAGDLSLVGPRPEQPRYVELFGASVYRYAHRHRIRGGITGWAQVNGLRGDTSIEERVIYDNFYIENWSLWLDVKILILTFLKAGFSAAEKAVPAADSRAEERDHDNRKAAV